MKRFSIDEWLMDPTRAVQTEDGIPVRVLSEVRSVDHRRSVIALIERTNKDGQIFDGLLRFADDGTCWDDATNPLIFAPVKRSRWVYIYTTDETGERLFTSLPYKSQEEAQECIRAVNSEGMRIVVKALTEITWEE